MNFIRLNTINIYCPWQMVHFQVVVFYYQWNFVSLTLNLIPICMMFPRILEASCKSNHCFAPLSTPRSFRWFSEPRIQEINGPECQYSFVVPKINISTKMRKSVNDWSHCPPWVLFALCSREHVIAIPRTNIRISLIVKNVNTIILWNFVMSKTG